MFLRLEPYMIYFSSIGLTYPCSRNSFIQYRIWDSKDDSRAIFWFSSFPFPACPSCVMVFFRGICYFCFSLLSCLPFVDCNFFAHGLVRCCSRLVFRGCSSWCINQGRGCCLRWSKWVYHLYERYCGLLGCVLVVFRDCL